MKNQMSKMNASIEFGGASFVLALDQARVTAYGSSRWAGYYLVCH